MTKIQKPITLEWAKELIYECFAREKRFAYYLMNTKSVDYNEQTWAIVIVAKELANKGLITDIETNWNENNEDGHFSFRLLTPKEIVQNRIVKSNNL